MEAAALLRYDDVRLYRPREKRVPLNFKVRESVKAGLRNVVRLWKMRAAIDGADPEDIDLTYVGETLLAIGVDDSWREVAELLGVDPNDYVPPSTEEDWERLEKDLKARAKKLGLAPAKQPRSS